MPGQRVRWRQVHRHWELYLFVLPTLALVALFQYYPAASGVFHSFFRWNGADISEFVGLDNYIDLLKSNAFWKSFKVVFTLGAWNVIKMAPALAVAVCIHRCRSTRMQYLYRMLFVVPMVIPPLVVVLVWRSFFFEATSGFLNRFLVATHFHDILIRLDQFLGWGGIFVEGQAPVWLGDPRLILTACIVWGAPWIGSFAVLTHLAKLQNIPKDIYEAADIDGVTWFSRFTRIELPLVMSSVYLNLVFVIIGTIKDAGMILALAGIEGGPGGQVTVPALFMLRKAFVDQRMGYACAVGIVLTAVVMTLQKLSTLVNDWSTLRPWQKVSIRMGSIAVALLMIWRSVLVPLASFILLVQLPWEAVAERLSNLRDRLTRRSREYKPPATSAFGDRMLRCSKHAFVIFVALFAFLPLYLMVVVSLKTNQQFYHSPAGITAPLHPENWDRAWHAIAPAIANSMVVAIAGTFLTMCFGLCAAYFFARKQMPLSRLLWNAVLILMMMPTIANLVPLFRLLKTMNLLNTLVALIIVGASAGQVFAIFVLRSFVSEIPHDLFEAAEIDGASHFQQMRKVVLPLAGPILGTVGVMHFITEWNQFVLPLIVMRDSSRLPVMVQLLRMAGEYIKFWGPLMAGYIIASLPVIILFAFCMKLFVRGMTEGAVKG